MYPKTLRKIVRDFYIRNKMSIRCISKIFQISKSTISRWILNKNKETEKNNKYNYEEICLKINLMIEKDCYIKLLDIHKKMKEEYNINISKTAIHNCIKKNKISYKRVCKKFYGKNKDELKVKQEEFRKKIKKISNKNIICIDESGFMTNECPIYGYSKKGKKIISYEKSNPIKYSLLMAITNKGILEYEIHKENINGEKYFLFIRNKILPYAKNKYILADNIGFHKSKKVIEEMKENKSKALFIPPYSPEFNSIENVFSIIKSKFRYALSGSNNKKDESVKILKTIIEEMKNTNFENIYKNVKKQ